MRLTALHNAAIVTALSVDCEVADAAKDERDHLPILWRDQNRAVERGNVRPGKVPGWHVAQAREGEEGSSKGAGEMSDAATAKQAKPSGSGNPILGMVLADLTNRALEGKEKYGEPLKAHNGRNALWDAYQEALDLTMYLRQLIQEQAE